MDNVPPPPSNVPPPPPSNVPPPPPSNVPPPPPSSPSAPPVTGPVGSPPGGAPPMSPGASFGGTPPPPIDPGRRPDREGRGIVIVAAVGVLALIALVGAVAVLVVGGDDDDAVATAPRITVPDITVPDITVPTITAPTVPDDADDAPGATAPQVAAPEVTVPGGTAPVTTVPPPVDLFTGSQAGDVVGEVAAARGADPLRILRALVYPEYAFLQVQDPSTPEHVDEYSWRGTLGDPAPVRLAGTGDLEEHLFSADEADWSAIPVLVAAAPGLTEIADGTVSHVIVHRPLPFSTDVRMRVFVSGARNSGYVDADAAGNVIAVSTT